MAVTDECTLRVVGRYQDQNIVNTLHYRIVGQASGEQDILDSLITLWKAGLTAGWVARHSDAYTLVGLKAFGKTGAAKTPAFQTDGTAGGVTGTEVSSPLCRTITLYTASSKHRRRGRIMMSGSDATMFDDSDGSVTSTEIGLLTALGVLMITPLSGAGDEFQLGIPTNGADLWEDITDAKGRETPSLVSSRRIRQFLIG